jgi:signal peptidase I
MENTLFTAQQLIEDKLSYNFIKPKRGDIIIFLENGEKDTIVKDVLKTADNIVSIFSSNRSSEESSLLVKRVIGTAGDEVDIRDGYVYINGNKLEETYVKGETFPRELQFPIKVEENKLFVLGDNRTVSKDSRTFGLIDIKQVEGKAVYRVYPFNQMGKISKTNTTKAQSAESNK